MDKLILIDNGHGNTTLGKRSPVWPDGSQLFEWEFNRSVAKMLQKRLDVLGIANIILVPEDQDISLAERCKRANMYHKESPTGAILISIHGNAGGGTGWECFTSPGKTDADAYATLLYQEAMKEFPDMRMRFGMEDGDMDKEDGFYILKNTICPAVLTENFFMDTESDCLIMMSRTGKQRIADFHARAINRMI
jgi:N-acetylmuramoyl-L-alanine amidase